MFSDSPRYVDADPVSRGMFLDWLAGDRSDTEYDIANVWLYFFGLETRFFMCRPSDEERSELVAEAKRLLNVYGDDARLSRRLWTFIDAGNLILGREPSMNLPAQRTREIFSYGTGGRLTLGQRAALVRSLSRKKPLNAETACWWILAIRGPGLGMSWKWGFKECRRLFRHLFDERYPNGMKVHPPEFSKHCKYQAASEEFSADLTSIVGPLPGAYALASPAHRAAEIATEVADAIQRYSRFLIHYPSMRCTVRAFSLLPEPARSPQIHDAVSRVRAWADAAATGSGLVGVDEAVRYIFGVVPKKLPKPWMFHLSDALGLLGFGAIPDSRWSMRLPKLGRQMVLFRLRHEYTLPRTPSAAFMMMFAAVSLGAYAAHSDGQISTPEHAYLYKAIAMSGLSDCEQEFLVAELNCMRAAPPPLRGARFRTELARTKTKLDLIRLCMATASADHPLSRLEIRALEKISMAIELPLDRLYSELHEFAMAEGRVAVRPPGKASYGSAISRVMRPVRGLRLDTARINGIMSDSSESGVLLEEVFGDDLADRRESGSPAPSVEGAYHGLDRRHSDFLEDLIAFALWSEKDLRALAVKHRLMPDGAIETLNEWSVSALGAELVEESNGYTLDPRTVQKVERLQPVPASNPVRCGSSHTSTESSWPQSGRRPSQR